MKEQERACFVDKTGLPDEAIVCHNLAEGPPTLASILAHDALMVGGSGDYYVSRRDLPGFDELMDVLRAVVEAKHPTYASCFGYQCLVEALGGEIVFDPRRTEVGTFELELTEAGATDPLFGTLPSRFWAQLGHKDRAVREPDGIPNLVSSERSPLQALRIPGAPIWASQFHPELDRESNLERFWAYMEGYASTMDEAEREAALTRFVASPETSLLLSRFLTEVFG
jgi:GMP synthase (glutamine-hydrolysing)